ncbi:hypothetical protein TIFTF001_034484 [Ficus carica]|uniref:Uncharacterized protein n=1 Tax=Ficus carica TaxID=3494 RepID=A0AA88J8W8_FICCA|nr:hypothetical protein TIFTF001_034484 [Ficus carica]
MLECGLLALGNGGEGKGGGGGVGRAARCSTHEAGPVRRRRRRWGRKRRWDTSELGKKKARRETFNMEFSISYSSLRLPATIPSQRYQTSSSFTRSIPVKATKSSNLPSKCSTNINLNLPTGLYGENKLSKSLLFGQNKRDSNRLKAFPGLIAIFIVHAYGNGINQVFDIDIDRVNKPYLHLVSGELSLKHAWLMMSFGVISGLLIFRLCNADLISTALYCFGLFLATSYSAPPFRFKGSALATTMLLPTVNFVQSVGIFYTANASLGRPFVWSPQTIFILAFSTIFFVVISIIKDIPDVEGDMKYNIRTFPARFGGKNVAYFAVGLLLLNYIGAIAAAILLPQVRFDTCLICYVPGFVASTQIATAGYLR